MSSLNRVLGGTKLGSISMKKPSEKIKERAVEMLDEYDDCKDGMYCISRFEAILEYLDDLAEQEVLCECPSCCEY